MSEVPDERRSYNIDGVAVGMSLEEALERCPGLKLDPSAVSLTGDKTRVRETTAAVEGGEIVAVRGATLSDGPTLLVKEGDTAQRISQKVVPLDLESTPLFLGACDSRSSAIMALDDDTSTLVSVRLLPDEGSDHWNSKWQVGGR